MNIDASVILAALAGGLALFFDYFPGVASWFNGLPVENKRLITFGLASLLGAAAFGTSCLHWFSTNLVCDVKTAWGLFYDIVLSVAVMYGFHMASKPSAGLKAKLGIK